SEDVAADPNIQLTWMPDADSAIVGVIDSGIALSHARFRRIDGGTRFLSAWLQGGEWRSGAAVPFGRELFRTEIDRLMWRASVGGAIDEAAFDRAAGLTQFGHARGDRRLENNATHGTHVADLAAGFDLSDGSFDEARRRLPIIGVGLPPRTSMGANGNFLEFFAIHAVEYIIDRADRIWKACGYGPDGGFPIVINLSYGLKAGPKDGHMLIEEVIRAATEKSDEIGRPIRVILPAGNDLMSEGVAEFALPDDRPVTLDWRIRPEDHTPNFAEVWSEQISGAGGSGPAHPLTAVVRLPLGPGSPAAAGRAGQMTTLTDDADPETPLARIYCRKHDNKPPGGTGDPAWHRVGYYLCTAPTLEEDRMAGAPSGRWTIEVAGKGKNSDRAHAYVQSDQTLTFGSVTGLLSTFDHPDFRPVDYAGRAIDVYDYPIDGVAPTLTDLPPPITRRGSLNAIANNDAVRVIGSYRATDGKASVFSSAASSEPVGDGRAAPTALLPGVDGAARFGVMAAGSKSGSAAAMQGTSFSTALATRRVALAMLEWIDGDRNGQAPGSEGWFEITASDEDADADWPGQVPEIKGGHGRMTRPGTGRLPR
ncbi:MAG: hypothetical protein KJO67_08485, partial [Silicimonas sp.]|nr:hypothetical protein [Silicimonas sp.]